ncbi:MAG TPA: hypothetical protein ENK54_06560 [Thiotrichales bacterium]|nr:hypothetical protein [Thiotrichales bacterium]
MVRQLRHGMAWGAVAVMVALLHPLRERIAPEGVNLLAEPPALRGAIGLLELLLVAAVFSRGGFRLLLPSPWRLLLLAWFAATTLSVIAADFLLMALMRQMEWLLHGAAALALWRLLGETPGGRERFRTVVMVALLLAMVMLVAGWLAVPDPEAYNWLQNVVGFVHLRFLGVFLVLGLPFYLAPWLGGGDGRPPAGGRRVWGAERWLGFAAAVAALGGLAWAAGRGPYLALLITTPLLVALRLVPFRAAGLLLAAAVLGAVISMPFWDDATGDTSTGLDRFVPQLGGGLDARLGTPLHQLATGRDLLWGAAWQAFLERPLPGWGPDGYRQVPLPGVDPRIQPLHPHNGLLQLLVEWGVAGTVLFTVLLIGWLRSAVRHLRGRERPDGVQLAALWSLLIGLVLSLVSGTLYHPWPLMFLSFCVAVASPLGGARESASAGRWRWLVAGGAVLAALPLVAHLRVAYLVQHPTLSPASPQAREARWVRHFPSWVASYPFQINVARWLNTWEQEGVAMGDWRRWYLARRYHGGPLE